MSREMNTGSSEGAPPYRPFGRGHPARHKGMSRSSALSGVIQDRRRPTVFVVCSAQFLSTRAKAGALRVI